MYLGPSVEASVSSLPVVLPTPASSARHSLTSALSAFSTACVWRLQQLSQEQLHVYNTIQNMLIQRNFTYKEISSICVLNSMCLKFPSTISKTTSGTQCNCHCFVIEIWQLELDYKGGLEFCCCVYVKQYIKNKNISDMSL